MIYIVKINNKEYEVEVDRGRANLIKTTEIVPSVASDTAVHTPAPASQPAAAPAPVLHSGTTAIKSPMPGTILDIKVTPGQSVKKGTLLLILEAMKMENEIVAPTDGVVAQVLVAKGASVATDDVLISIQ
jgi:biotin carboxyl carrier protein